jgi:hypothetical protein
MLNLSVSFIRLVAFYKSIMRPLRHCNNADTKALNTKQTTNQASTAEKIKLLIFSKSGLVFIGTSPVNEK